jgi:hypothetical protein
MAGELQSQRIFRALKFANVMDFWVPHPRMRAAPSLVFCSALSNGCRYQVAHYIVGFASFLRIKCALKRLIPSSLHHHACNRYPKHRVLESVSSRVPAILKLKLWGKYALDPLAMVHPLST